MPEETTTAVTTAAPHVLDQVDWQAIALIALGVFLLLILLAIVLIPPKLHARKHCDYCDGGKKILCRRVEEREKSIVSESEEFYAEYCPICGQAIPKKDDEG